MTQDLISVVLDVRDTPTRAALERVLRSVPGFAIGNPDDSGPADLLVMEIGYELEKEFHALQSLLSLGTVGEVFLTSSKPDKDILVQALRAGAREFLSQPIQEKEFRQSLEKFIERRRHSLKGKKTSKSGRIITLVGSKGGVGTTTIAVNLANSLIRHDHLKSVALIDLNLLFGEIPLLLDITPTYHWGEIARNITRLDATFLMSVLHQHSSGIYVLSSPSQLAGQHAATPDVMEQLLTLMRRVFDFVVIDAGQTTDDVSLKVLESADTVFLVSVLSLPCLANVNRLLRLFFDLGYPHEDNVKVIVSRYVKNTDVSLKDAERSLNKKIFWTIPNDYKATMSSMNQGKVLSEVAPRSPVTTSIDDLAVTLLGKKSRDDGAGWGLKLFRRSH